MVGRGPIVATGSIAVPAGPDRTIGAMIGAEKVMTMTSTYDHRVIQGAESGRFLQIVEAYLQGDPDFYDGVSRLARRRARPLPAPPAPAQSRRRRGARRGTGSAARRRRRSTSRCCSRCRPRTSPAEGPPPRTATSPARLDRWGTEPEGDRARRRRPSASAGGHGQDPGQDPAHVRAGATLADALPHLRETYCGTIAYEIEHIASHRQRMWLREKIEAASSASR
jgi:2-oxoglutarate dehydrogenase E1 component